MRCLFLSILLSCLLGRTTALDLGISHAVYATPDEAYLEVNLEIAAQSITFKPVDTLHLQAAVEVLIAVMQGDKVINYEKYLLKSLLTNLPIDLLDVKRLSVPAGDYRLEVVVTDVNDEKNKASYNADLKVSNEATLRLSDVQLLRSFKPDQSEHPFTKNGFFLEPLPFSFYDQSATILAFYAEIYHADKVIAHEQYGVRYFVEQDKGNGVWALISVGNQNKKPAPIDALLVQMDIRNYESGNYRLTLELRGKDFKLLTERKILFQRSNPLLNFATAEINDELLSKQFVKDLELEDLTYCLKALLPFCVSDESETVKTIIKEKDVKKMRYFVFRHFAKQDANHPENAYQRYMDVANAAHNRFKSGFRYGFETDRGRTFLKFGKPDDMIHIEDDPSAPHYEIWIYYDFPKTKQTNVKFLFYNPSLAGEDFIILHSTARGEINNPRWERELYKKTATQEFDGDNFHDATAMKRNIGRNARAYFEDL
jgi:GWxTD domain-containing protein